MTSEQLMEIYKYMAIVAGGVSVAITTIVKLFGYLEKRAKEQSVGATAVLGLMQKDKDIQEDIETLREKIKEKNEEHDEEIGKLAKDIREFAFNALSLLKINK